MLNDRNGANEITIEDIENFLNGDGATPPVVETEEGTPEAQPNQDTKVTETQAFAHRLKEEKEKVRREERDSLAKSLGYDNYESMQKAREKKLLEERGLDVEEVAPIVEEIVKKRLETDPRLKELESYRQQKVNEWAKKELTDIKELTGGKISKIEDVPKDVIELWKTKGSLKAAYLELRGEALIREARTSAASNQSRGSTSHLNNPDGTPSPINNANKRPLTPEERNIYKLFNPDVTEEQLSKMFKDK